MPTVPRLEGTTTLSHYMLELLLPDHGMEVVGRLQVRLSQQDPKEQVHYLMRILLPRLQMELQAEPSRRGQREKVDFYVGELIGKTLDASTPLMLNTATAASSTTTDEPPAVKAENHPLWPALSELCKTRRHGWEPASSVAKIGPRRLAKRENLLLEVGPQVWDAAIAEVAAALALTVPQLLSEFSN